MSAAPIRIAVDLMGGDHGPAVTLPPPPAGNTAWQVVANGGEKKYGATVPDATPWITVGQDGSVRAKIPASEQTKAAQPGLDPQNLGALTIRRAP